MQIVHRDHQPFLAQNSAKFFDISLVIFASCGINVLLMRRGTADVNFKLVILCLPPLLVVQSA